MHLFPEKIGPNRHSSACEYIPWLLLLNIFIIVILIIQSAHMSYVELHLSNAYRLKLKQQQKGLRNEPEAYILLYCAWRLRLITTGHKKKREKGKCNIVWII